jgi:hypothetical protein
MRRNSSRGGRRGPSSSTRSRIPTAASRSFGDGHSPATAAAIAAQSVAMMAAALPMHEGVAAALRCATPLVKPRPVRGAGYCDLGP